MNHVDLDLKLSKLYISKLYPSLCSIKCKTVKCLCNFKFRSSGNGRF